MHFRASIRNGLQGETTNTLKGHNTLKGQVLTSFIIEIRINLSVLFNGVLGNKRRTVMINIKTWPQRAWFAIAEQTGDKALAKEAGIFDTPGYHEYTDSEDLHQRLSSHIGPLSQQIDETPDRKAPIYHVCSRTHSDFPLAHSFQWNNYST